MVKAPKLYKDENGAGFLLVIFVLFVMLGVGGLVVDMGIIYKTKGEMRKAANAAVLSGIQEIFVSDASVTKVVHYILKAHNEESSLESLNIKPNGENKVVVTLNKEVPLYFMRIFGINSVPVEVASSAKAGALSAGSRVVPLGIK